MEYIEERRDIPIPTYFIGDFGVAAPKVLSASVKDPANLGFKMDGFRVCNNLFWLKGSGNFTLFGLYFFSFMILFTFYLLHEFGDLDVGV